MIAIRKATSADWPAIWSIFHSVVSTGDTHVNSPDSTEEDAHAYWIAGSLVMYKAL